MHSPVMAFVVGRICGLPLSYRREDAAAVLHPFLQGCMEGGCGEGVALFPGSGERWHMEV